MSGYEHLYASQYLFESYQSAAADGEQFERTGDVAYLVSAAETLCGAFGRLREDREFWAALIDATNKAANDPDSVREVLASLTDFRVIEENVLVGLGFSPNEASRITSDLICALRLVDEFPSGASIENLEARITEFGAQICAVAVPPDEDADPRHDRSQRKKRVKQGLKFLAGAVTVAGNGVAAIAFAPTLASVVAGVLVMGDAVTD